MQRRVAAIRRPDDGAFVTHPEPGRPLGSEAFVEEVGMLIGHDPQGKRSGRKV